ncbi:MAG: hypothetical protein RLZZ227_993 [Pseudomonadota bacterium]
MRIDDRLFPLKTARLAAGIALIAFAGSSAQAQTAPPLEQIVVTAKKRSQSQQRVNISMSVIPRETVEALNLRSLPDAAALVENVELFEDFPGAGIPTWIIRGVGLQDFNSNNTPTAGVYLDEGYQVATVMGGAGLFDVEQIEVLKGPQGGLYGRNTSGGAIILNTRRAKLDSRDAWVNVGYGSWQTTTAQGGFNVPLADSAAWRVAARSESSKDGWQKSLGTGATHGEKDRWDLRSWLLVEPTEALTVQWKVQGGRDVSDIALGRSIGVYTRGTPPVPCAAILAGRRDDASCINFGGVNRIRRNRGEVPELISAQGDDGGEVFSDPFNQQKSDYVNSVFDLTLALDAVDLRSITSFDRFGYGVALDLDGSRGEYAHRISNSDIRVLSQEFRVVSTAGSPLQWLAGASFSTEDFAETREFNLRDNTLVPLFRGHLSYDQNTKASAVFADAEYELNPQWSIATELRYTDEDKEYRNGDFHLLLANPVYYARNLQADYALDHNFSGSFGVNWQPLESLFTYAKLSRGFKSGGFYGGFPFSPIEVEPYLEETITAAELGFRKRLPDYALQLNGAVFHYEYEDVQGYIQTLNPLTNTGIDRLANQGDAEHDGAELQVQWQPLSGLDVVAGIAWLDAEFVSTGRTTSNILRQQVEITGRRPYAPEWSGNLVINYRHDVGAGLQLDWNLAYDYRSEFAGRQSVAAEAAINQLPGYGLFNAGLALSRSDSRWATRLWMRNISDKAYRTRMKGDGVGSYIEMFGEPRSIGINVEYRL